MIRNLVVTIAADNVAQSWTANVPTRASWAKITPDSGNAQVLYYGGANVDANNGMPLDVGAADVAPWPASSDSMSDLKDFYVYGKTGDKLRIVYGRF